MSLFDDVLDFRARQDTEAQAKVDTFAGGMITALTGTVPDVTVPVPEANDQLAELASTTAANAGAIAALQANQDGAANSGIHGGDEFSRVNASDVGPGWATSQSGTTTGGYRVNGSEAYWSAQGNNTVTVRHRRTDLADQHTDTAYQKIQLVIGTQVAQGDAIDRIYGRVADDESTYVFAQWRDGQAQLYCNSGGGDQPLGSSASTIPAGATSNAKNGVGNIWTLECGTTGGLRQYRLTRNGRVVLTVTDNSSVTAAMDSNRGWGWGGVAIGGSGTGVHRKPSSVTRVTVADNAPAAIVGTTFRAYRSLSSGLLVANGERPITGGMFNTVDYISNDLSWNPATCELTTQTAGTFMASMRMQIDTNLGMATGHVIPIWYVNGVAKAGSGAVSSLTANGFGVPAGALQSTVGGDPALFYVPAGGVIRPYMRNDTGWTFIGEAGGIATWLSVAKVG